MKIPPLMKTTFTLGILQRLKENYSTGENNELFKLEFNNSFCTKNFRILVALTGLLDCKFRWKESEMKPRNELHRIHTVSNIC